MNYRPKHILEYTALRAMSALVNALPYPAALAVGWVNARLSYAFLRSRTAEARRRIRVVFADTLAPREVDAIAWRSWRNIVFNAVEILRIGGMTRRWIDSVVVDNADLLKAKAHFDTGKGGVIACPHMGNWDLAGVACHLYGIPIFNVAGRQRNPLTNRFLNDLRTRPGIPSIERGSGTMREVIRRLRGGEALAILPDVRMPAGGIRVPFLGGEANVGTGMALFARHAGVPILPSCNLRIGWRRHRIRTADPIYPDPGLSKDEDVRRMTEAVLRQVDEWIRVDPGQWFWFNKRWVLDPVIKE